MSFSTRFLRRPESSCELDSSKRINSFSLDNLFCTPSSTVSRLANYKITVDRVAWKRTGKLNWNKSCSSEHPVLIVGYITRCV